MKLKTLCLAAFLCLGTQIHSQLLLKLYGDTLFAYEYAEGDEFNAPRLDESYWTNGLGWTRVLMSQDLSFNPNNVKQEEGLLKLIADKKDSVYTLGMYEIDSGMVKRKNMTLVNNQFLTKYSAGCIISKKKFHYGLYELRFKVEEGQGVWPAFWFFGGSFNDEIDGFELKGEKRKHIHADTHCRTGCDRGYTDKYSWSKNWGGWLPVKEPLDEAYNLMHLEWESAWVNWYFNGHPLAHFRGKFSTPMNLYLNTSVAKDGEAFKPGPNEKTKWPNTYTVDFIRIWNAIGKADTLKLKRGYLSNPDSSYSNKPVKKSGLTYKKSEFSALKAFIYVSVDAQNKLHIRVTGSLNNPKTRLKLSAPGWENEVKDLSKETVLDLKPGLAQIRLEIIDGKRSYVKHLMLP